MGAYKRDVVVVIKMGAYVHGVLICVDVYYPDFTVIGKQQKHRYPRVVSRLSTSIVVGSQYMLS